MAEQVRKTPTVDEYLAEFPEEVREVLEKVRQTIREAAPGAVEVISYGVPTFDLNGRHLVHFAGFKHHISFFPTSSPIPVFEKELTPYRTSRGTIQFQLGTPVPYELINKITAYRVREVTGE